MRILSIIATFTLISVSAYAQEADIADLIKEALSAAPPEIAANAAVEDWEGNVLRERRLLFHGAFRKLVTTIAGRDDYLGPYGTKASHLEHDRLIAEWLASGRPTSLATDPRRSFTHSECPWACRSART